MYKNKLVVSLKTNGRILREYKDTVFVKFGSEYSFLIKNLNTTRALVNIFIDGEDVIEGGLVLSAGQEVDLERYVKNGNLSAGNKFKFIERTANVEEHRGVKLEDGLVRIEFQYEKPRPVLQVAPTYTKTGSPWGGVYASGASYNVNGVMRGVDWSAGEAMKASATSATTATLQSMNISTSISDLHDGAATMDWNDVGITVPGSKSTQKFQTCTMGEMEAEKHTIVLKLLGETPNNKPIQNPVTVKSKQKCDTCGKMNKAHSKFCVECGTALEIFA